MGEFKQRASTPAQSGRRTFPAGPVFQPNVFWPNVFWRSIALAALPPSSHHRWSIARMVGGGKVIFTGHDPTFRSFQVLPPQIIGMVFYCILIFCIDVLMFIFREEHFRGSFDPLILSQRRRAQQRQNRTRIRNPSQPHRRMQDANRMDRIS